MYCKKAVNGFVYSLIGFLFSWIPVAGLVLSIIGVVTCSNVKKLIASSQTQYEESGLTTAGLVLGIIGIIAGAGVMLWWLIFGIFLGNTMSLFKIFSLL